MTYLLSATPAIVQPVCVVAPGSQLANKFGSPQGVQTELPTEMTDGQRVAFELVKRIDPRRCLVPQFVEARSDDPNATVDALLSVGVSFCADLIVANTHGWTGLSRIFRGSFVDRLLAQSQIPVLALGPEVQGVRQFDRILYATHLDRFSNCDFRQVVKFAALFRSRLTILHLLSRRERDQDGENSTAVGESLPQRSHLSRRARAWSAWAAKQGVNAEVVVEDCLTQVTVQILGAGDDLHVGLICLESRSGSLASVLKGCRVREVIQTARCPVWVRRISIKDADPKSSSGECQRVA